MLNTATKSDFASLINVTPGRVTQLISEGKIGDCLVGEGRGALIDVDKAIEKLKLRRDPGQAIANGAKMQLGALEEADELDLSLKRAKLEEAETRNRKLREEERARAGTYVLADHVRSETSKLTATILGLFEGGLADIAAEIAATYKLPARDVVHLVRKHFRDVRARVSTRLSENARSLAPTLEESTTEL